MSTHVEKKLIEELEPADLSSGASTAAPVDGSVGDEALPEEADDDELETIDSSKTRSICELDPGWIQAQSTVGPRRWPAGRDRGSTVVDRRGPAESRGGDSRAALAALRRGRDGGALVRARCRRSRSDRRRQGWFSESPGLLGGRCRRARMAGSLVAGSGCGCSEAQRKSPIWGRISTIWDADWPSGGAATRWSLTRPGCTAITVARFNEAAFEPARLAYHSRGVSMGREDPVVHWLSAERSRPRRATRGSESWWPRFKSVVARSSSPTMPLRTKNG